MKPRARRITIVAAILGAGVLAVFVVAHWGTVRDHVVAWHFQFTTETVTIEPGSASKRQSDHALTGDSFVGNSSTFGLQDVCRLLSNYSGHPVINGPADWSPIYDDELLEWPVDATPVSAWAGSSEPVEIKPATADLAMRILRANGYRVLEQRFPRSAYVVIRDPTAVPPDIDDGWRQNFLDEVRIRWQTEGAGAEPAGQ